MVPVDRKLSVIIPCLNEVMRIVPLLQSLQPLRARGHEIIVVDGGSDDDTRHCAEPLADAVIASSRGRARQQNKGASVASGAILWFLHADSMVPPDADKLIFSALAGSKVWGRFDVQLSGSHPVFRIIEHAMNMRSRITGIATGDQGMFVERNVFHLAGGFPRIELMEDVRLSRYLQRYSRPACLTVKLKTSSRRWEQNGIVRTILLMWWLRLAHFFGVSPSRLANWYGYNRTEQNTAVVLVFARAPVPGQAKTRLIPALGEQGSAKLHKRLVRQSLGRVASVTGVDVQLCCAPDTSHPFFSELSNSCQVPLQPQHGADLGERMHAAFESALCDYQHVVLIGTDCPELQKNDIEQAINALREGNDVVLGPAEDGGYVLIGLSQSQPTLFTGIDWGTSLVLKQTHERIQEAGLRLFELPILHDLDTPADLKRFPELMAE
jgi:rSAM/selenodomain-associated transferase 2/rSAM/selenodomain-associated transferase 1